MHYLEKEFLRLIKYAEGLGIKVTLLSENNKTASAAWVTDGSEIFIYNAKKGPLRKCLDLIHELAHHKAYTSNNRKSNTKLDYILVKQELGKELTKKQRKDIYIMESKDSTYQKEIHKDINSKIPIRRLELDIEFDLWIYKYFYLNNKWPSRAEKKAKSKLLRGKYVLG